MRKLKHVKTKSKKGFRQLTKPASDAGFEKSLRNAACNPITRRFFLKLISTRSIKI